MASSMCKTARIARKYFISTSNLKRCLFTEEKLGLNGFRGRQKKVRYELGNIKEGFFSQMEKLVVDGSNLPVFGEDLKIVIHCAETDQDLVLVEKMLRRSQILWKSTHQYNYGPVIMRLLHTLNKADLAFNWHKDEGLSSMFQHLSTKLVLLDLLYENGKYNDVKDIFDSMKAEVKNLRDDRTLAYLSLYRLNTSEGFQYVMDDFDTALVSNSDSIAARSIEVAAAFALKQENPTAALQIVTHLEKRTQTFINLQVSAYSKLDRVEDALNVISYMLATDVPENIESQRCKIFQESIAEIETSLARNSEPKLEQEFQSMKTSLKSGGFMHDTTLQEQVTKQIPHKRLPHKRYNSRVTQ